MKKLILPALLTIIAIIVSGCSVMKASKKFPDGSVVEFSDWSLFSNSARKGLVVDGTTKTTAKLLGLTAGSTEPNPESITASGAALGELIGTAAKTTIKP